MGNCSSDLEQTASPAPQSKEQSEERTDQEEQPSLGEQALQGVRQEVQGELQKSKQGAQDELTSDYQEMKDEAHERAREEQAEVQDTAKNAIKDVFSF
eukprot:CAMPEP_0202350260 /NCGR_PEP_ID=MMETSP1126-20121109/7407_1 /ASSEMBLY_ACC=CAM_ASM_000457 /TAXON_ID=3047 /ORGANISM="Dunaliella tertiolecta, Strain CCMP1320" /LENGTH=97 /DNA_ID=CAMNT_0048942203 /DNA_START=104 /DNA_END=397 /DNA_ORIENTATION=-